MAESDTESTGSIISEGGSSTDTSTWYSDLPDEMQQADVVQSSKTFEDFAKTAIHAQSMVGMDKVAIPAKDDDPGWAGVWDKLGRPEESSGYKMPEDAVPVEGAGLSEDGVKAFLGRAHELGLSQRQAAGLYGWYVKDQVNGVAETAQSNIQNAREESISSLKREFGQAFDERLGHARSAVTQFGGDDLKAILDSSGLGDNPVVVRAFANIGKAMADDSLYQSGERPGIGGALSPVDARAEIETLQKDEDFISAYMSRAHPGHEEALKKFSELHRLSAGLPREG